MDKLKKSQPESIIKPGNQEKDHGWGAPDNFLNLLQYANKTFHTHSNFLKIFSELKKICNKTPHSAHMPPQGMSRLFEQHLTTIAMYITAMRIGRAVVICDFLSFRNSRFNILRDQYSNNLALSCRVFTLDQLEFRLFFGKVHTASAIFQ
ncbi:hypothetical protein KM92DES2_10865 [uncultured Desulfovibrio sp.]|uniref:Uncharacterized protein n=1 Tax=uncultured Desulfovibrio sp. TaxID=167968 RepID=A0A212JC10_9BACT|nr:hypothetical protein KM92DES2_10865 [uncultured Desulfovibrio sp.]